MPHIFYMINYHQTKHVSYFIHLHLLWVTKNRQPILQNAVAGRVRELARDVCARNEVEIIRGRVSPDHVQFVISIPPKLLISRLVSKVMDKTAYRVYDEFPHVSKVYPDHQIWAPGYLCCSVGNLSDKEIEQYVEIQSRDDAAL